VGCINVGIVAELVLGAGAGHVGFLLLYHVSWNILGSVWLSHDLNLLRKLELPTL
jgi:hypothetical protein